MPIPADVVVMELPAEHAEQAGAALESCRLVLGGDRCRSSDEFGPTPGYFAVVQWQTGAPQRVHVEVHRERADGPLIHVREVEFSPDDTWSQRYKAIGLLVVSHVMAEAGRAQFEPRPPSGETRTGPEVPAPPQPKPQTPNPSPSIGLDSAKPETRSTEGLGFGVDLGGHFGTGPTNGVSRRGAFVRPWLGPFGDLWRPFARIGWVTHAATVEIDGYEGALGLGLHFEIARPFSVQVNASAVLQHLRFRASDSELGTDRDALTRYGARVGLEGEAKLAQHVGLWLGAEMLAATPPYVVEVQAERLGQEEGPQWGAVFGLRFQR